MSLVQNREVFISYNSADAELATQIHRMLNDLGISNWFAGAGDIATGLYYAKEIDAAIAGCKIFLLLASKNSIGSLKQQMSGSQEVANEIQIASNNRSFFIILRLDSSADETQYHLATKNWVDIEKMSLIEKATEAALIIKKRLKDGIPTDETYLQRSSQSEQSINIEKIEIALKSGNTSLAKTLLTKNRFSKEYDYQILLLKVITSMIRNKIRSLQPKSIDKLSQQLQSLVGSPYENIALYLMAILSTSYFEQNCVFDKLGGFSQLHQKSKHHKEIPAKYTLMARNIECINIELKWEQ